jgi:hypothetical protein
MYFLLFRRLGSPRSNRGIWYVSLLHPLVVEEGIAERIMCPHGAGEWKRDNPLTQVFYDSFLSLFMKMEPSGYQLLLFGHISQQ